MNLAIRRPILLDVAGFLWRLLRFMMRLAVAYCATVGAVVLAAYWMVRPGDPAAEAVRYVGRASASCAIMLFPACLGAEFIFGGLRWKS